MTAITARNITAHELMGLEVEVASASNPSLVAVRGRVVDESRNTLVIEGARGKRRVTKLGATFRLRLPDGAIVEVEGAALAGRPEDRAKRMPKRGW